MSKIDAIDLSVCSLQDRAWMTVYVHSGGGADTDSAVRSVTMYTHDPRFPRFYAAAVALQKATIARIGKVTP